MLAQQDDVDAGRQRTQGFLFADSTQLLDLAVHLGKAERGREPK